MFGDEEWNRRQAERKAREMALDAEQWEKGSILEALLLSAETDNEASKIIAVARLFDAEAFAIRERILAWVEKERRGSGGNDPDRIQALRVHERVARLSIFCAVGKAKAAIGLIEGWRGFV